MTLALLSILTPLESCSVGCGRPSPYLHLPWGVLEGMYRSGEDRSGVLWAMAGCSIGADREAARGFLRSIVDEPFGKEDLESIAKLVARVVEPSWVERLLEAYTGQEELGLAIRRSAEKRHLASILEKVRTLSPIGLARLVDCFGPTPPQEVRALASEKIAAAAKENGDVYYVERWWDAVGLAYLGDEKVVNWAVADVGGKAKGCCALQHYILTWSPLPKAARAVEAMLEAGDPHDVWKVVGGYGDVPRAAPWERRS